MPEHVHLLVLPRGDRKNIASLLKAIKRPYSSQVKGKLQAEHSPLLAKLTVRQRPGVMTFRDWREGPGYDRNLDNQIRLKRRSTTFTGILFVAVWSIGPLIGDGRVPGGLLSRNGVSMGACHDLISFPGSSGIEIGSRPSTAEGSSAARRASLTETRPQTSGHWTTSPRKTTLA
jgi:hypothetical protein